MKKLLIIITVITSVFLVSCDSQKASKLNEKIVVIQNNLAMQIRNNPIDLDGGNNASRLKQVSDFAKGKIEEIKSAEAPSGGEDFKNAMINNLQSIHDLYEYAIKLTNPKLTEDEKSKIETEITVMYAKATVVENKVMEEQRKFAKKYNFKLR
ncbi:MAG: hypothetical protein IPJ81_14390 [Chitinophagaceae bacterium]|nr:hypothetical protein [Chitinophagaceae bacterium]